MPLGTQNHPKMHQNSMFFPPKTPNCANKVILGRVVFLAIFWVSFFPVFGRIWSQNGVLGKKNFRPTFTLFRPFWRSKPFFCGRRLFYRFFSQKDQKNAKIRSESTENTIEFDPNSSENSMLKMGGRWLGSAATIRPPIRRMSEGVLDQAHRLSSLKSLLAGVRVFRRGYQLHPFFSVFFSDQNVSLQNPSRDLPTGFPRDPQIA